MQLVLSTCLGCYCCGPAQAFTYFDKDNDAQLTVREMKDSVTAVFKERKNMAHSLKVGSGGWAWQLLPLQQCVKYARAMAAAAASPGTA
jgi:ferredoxin